MIAAAAGQIPLGDVLLALGIVALFLALGVGMVCDVQHACREAELEELRDDDEAEAVAA